MDSGVVRLRKYHWQMVLIFLLKLIWFAGEACLLSRSEKSSRTSYRSPSNDWFWWCSQFWGSFRHNFKIAVGYLKRHCATCGIYLHLPELHFQIFLLLQVDGDLHTTAKFVDHLKIPYIAPSFGGCESIVDQPAIMSYWYVSHFINTYLGIITLWVCLIPRVYSNTSTNLKAKRLEYTDMLLFWSNSLCSGLQMAWWITYIGDNTLSEYIKVNCYLVIVSLLHLN